MTKRGAHVRDSVDLKRILIIVVLALVPAMLFGMWNTGYQHSNAFGLDWSFWQMFWYGLVKVIPLYLVSYIVGLGIEFISAQIKGHEVSEGYLVSGMLIPLIVPVDVPLWMLAIAVAFAVILGKEVFGGTGMNIWNPALLCRAFLFFSYPSKMSGDTVWTGGLSRYLTEGTAYATNGNGLVDAFSGATPLAHPSIEGLQQAGTSFMDLFIGTVPGSVGETSVIAILIGAIILIWTGVASWKIMLSSVIGGLAMGYLGYACGVTDLPGYYQLVLGGFAFGTVFMAAGRTAVNMWTTMLAVVACMMGSSMLLPLLGVVGVAIGLLLGSVVMVLCRAIASMRLVHFRVLRIRLISLIVLYLVACMGALNVYRNGIATWPTASMLAASIAAVPIALSGLRLILSISDE